MALFRTKLTAWTADLHHQCHPGRLRRPPGGGARRRRVVSFIISLGVAHRGISFGLDSEPQKSFRSSYRDFPSFRLCIVRNDLHRYLQFSCSLTKILPTSAPMAIMRRHVGTLRIRVPPPAHASTPISHPFPIRLMDGAMKTLSDPRLQRDTDSLQISRYSGVRLVFRLQRGPRYVVPLFRTGNP